jgi:hypothetical protein
LVLDDPFFRLDSRGTASLAAVLDGFTRQGPQVLVFTGQASAVERFASLGSTVHDIATLRIAPLSEPLIATVAPVTPPDQSSVRPPSTVKRASREKRTKRRPTTRRRDASSNSNHSDAA